MFLCCTCVFCAGSVVAVPCTQIRPDYNRHSVLLHAAVSLLLIAPMFVLIWTNAVPLNLSGSPGVLQSGAG